MLVQLDLFQEKSEVEILEEKIWMLEKAQDKLRKALFAKHGDLAKKYCDLHHRMDILEHNICKGMKL
jgi:hypothetical protein